MRPETSAVWRSCVAALNVLAPGAGLILAGALAEGLALGIAFLLAANVVVWSMLLAPDDFSDGSRAIAALVGMASFLAAQVRLTHAWRWQEVQAAELRRRQALAAAQSCTSSGDYAAARSVLESLGDLKSSDLLVAYLLAQALSGLGAQEQARVAWAQVRKLDRDGIYRDQVRQALRALDTQAAAELSKPASSSA